MIDITINLTIDQDHEEDFEQIMKHIASTPGISKVDVKTETYFEYNIDSTPHWEVDYEEVDFEEITKRYGLWQRNQYTGNKYLLSKVDEETYLAVDNSSDEYFTETFKTREEAIEWLNGEETE